MLLDLFDEKMLDDLSSKALSSSRLRTNYDLRDTSEDQSQRMLNAVEPGSILPIHRHLSSSENVIVLRGSITQEFYDEKGQLQQSVYLSATSLPRGMSVPIGQWHRLVSNESGTVLFVVKNGPYMPLSEEEIMSI